MWSYLPPCEISFRQINFVYCCISESFFDSTVKNLQTSTPLTGAKRERGAWYYWTRDRIKRAISSNVVLETGSPLRTESAYSQGGSWSFDGCRRENKVGITARFRSLVTGSPKFWAVRPVILFLSDFALTPFFLRPCLWFHLFFLDRPLCRPSTVGSCR